MNASLQARMRCTLVTLLAASALLLGNHNASAATTGGSATIPLTSTDYSLSVSLPKFDPNLGTLTSVQFTINGTVMSDIRGQNTSPNVQIVTGTAAAAIDLTRPDTTDLVSVLPSQSDMATLQPYNGSVMFDGSVDLLTPDFVDFGLIAATASNTTGALTGAGDLTLFTGPGGSPGTISLPVSAKATSSFTAGGSVLSQVTTEAGVTVTVTYTYTPNNTNNNGPFTTFTQGGWGTAPHGGNPGAFLKANFSKVYPSGKVVIGGGFTITLVGQPAIQAFLPQGGTPAKLTKSYLNPTSKITNLAGQVLSVQLAVDFSNAAVTRSGLGALKVQSGPLQGYTVAQVLSLGNAVLGGDTSGLPAGVSISTLNDVLTNITSNYDDGTVDHGYLGP